MISLLSGRRILVVEDEVMVAWMLEDMLANLGCEVVGPATRIDQALTMLDVEVFDAVVLDINLNGQKSYPVADALIARRVPFVFSTGYHRSSLLNGYTQFPMLQKPFAQSKLGEVLLHLLTLQETDASASKASV
jgi:CheY-like chemotaxis protein